MATPQAKRKRYSLKEKADVLRQMQDENLSIGQMERKRSIQENLLVNCFKIVLKL